MKILHLELPMYEMFWSEESIGDFTRTLKALPTLAHLFITGWVDTFALILKAIAAHSPTILPQLKSLCLPMMEDDNECVDNNVRSVLVEAILELAESRLSVRRAHNIDLIFPMSWGKLVEPIQNTALAQYRQQGLNINIIVKSHGNHFHVENFDVNRNTFDWVVMANFSQASR